jgi:hypothetical protein
MYRCERCLAVVPPRTPARRLVVETRLVEHPYRKDAGVRIVDGKPKKYDDPGGSGSQIAREQIVCPWCAEKS